ncbi:MAG: RrF2 family transcriptional regulator [Candidatus Omnitrophota bacterium]
MFKLNKKIKYALIALKHINGVQNDQLTSAKDICASYGIPFDPTARTLQLLAQDGILRAAQGARGGYRLNCDLDKVSLKDLSDILIGPVKMADCLGDDEFRCSCIEQCIVISPLIVLNDRIDHFLKDISIKSLITAQPRPDEELIRARLKKQPTLK